MLQCPQENVVFMQGDFNCTINSVLDRNHNEPHPLSAEILKKLVNRHDFMEGGISWSQVIYLAKNKFK